MVDKTDEVTIIPKLDEKICDPVWPNRYTWKYLSLDEYRLEKKYRRYAEKENNKTISSEKYNTDRNKNQNDMVGKHCPCLSPRLWGLLGIDRKIA